jgi:outer membrane immunogenic protein
MTKAFASAAFVGIAVIDSSAAMAGPPPPPPIYYSWTGIYVGAEAGYLTHDVRYSGGLAGSISGSTGIAGGYVGANYQFNNNFVIGGEIRFDGTDFDQRFGMLNTHTGYVFSGVVRFGYVTNNVVMPYVTIGGAVTDQFQSFPAISASNTRTGWTVGGGVELNISNLLRKGVNYRFDNTPLVRAKDDVEWIARVDYRHTSYGKSDSFGDLRTRLCSDVVLVGVAAKFSAAPVSAYFEPRR